MICRDLGDIVEFCQGVIRLKSEGFTCDGRRDLMARKGYQIWVKGK